MILLDTNVFIYIANHTLNRSIIADIDISYSDITKIEALGFANIQANEQLLLRRLFDEAYAFNLVPPIIETAVTLRQLKRMSLGDSVVAATALVYGLELWTTNVKDFDHIKELKLYNPKLRED